MFLYYFLVITERDLNPGHQLLGSRTYSNLTTILHYVDPITNPHWNLIFEYLFIITNRSAQDYKGVCKFCKQNKRD